MKILSSHNIIYFSTALRIFRSRAVPAMRFMAAIGGFLTVCIALSSCFTGIESTKKITLSRDDKREIAPTPEELLLADVKPTSNEEWQAGKLFLVTDDRASVVIDSKSIISGKPTLQRGDTLRFYRSVMMTSPDGVERPYVEFLRGRDVFGYSAEGAGKKGTTIMSDELPGVVDCAMVDQAREIMLGRKLWTRSPLWLDESGNRKEGLKFVPVKVLDVAPGNMVFPLNVSFADEHGNVSYYLMNFGSTGRDSRSVANLFSLTDPKRSYPAISEHVWDNIRRGKVELGMTKDECRLAKGNPTDVNVGHDYSKTLLLWSYPDAMVLYFEDGILTGINNFGK